MPFIFILLMGLGPAANAWTLNDVSILLPLPKPGEQELLLGPNAQAAKGRLLPYEIFENLPRLVFGFDRREIFGFLKVVAIRIDPCFRERNGPTGCRRQIRMVWQPVLASGRSTLTADAAVHTFYDLNDEEWSSLIRDLNPLAGADERESLDVHPRIRAQGLNGEHWEKLKTILLKYTGKENLKRATTMSVDTIGSIWAFAGVDIENGALKRMMIPRGHHVVQSIVADISNLNGLRFNINPLPEAPKAWLDLLSFTNNGYPELTDAQIRDGLRENLKLENPNLEDTGSVDCVSCHVAQNIRIWGERRLPAWRWKFEDENYKNSETADLKNNSVQPGQVNRLRAFGYFLDEPIISQRLIHESAEVLNGIRLSLKNNDCQNILGGNSHE